MPRGENSRGRELKLIEHMVCVAFEAMEPGAMCFADLPKPFLQLLLNDHLDSDSRFRLRAASKEVLSLVDELSSLICCITGDKVPLSKIYLVSRLSSGITSLLLPELKLVPHNVTFRPGAFYRLQHLVLNYR